MRNVNIFDRRRLGFISLLALGALLMAACGDGAAAADLEAAAEMQQESQVGVDSSGEGSQDPEADLQEAEAAEAQVEGEAEAEAEAEVEAEAEIEAQDEGLPPIVPGDPNFRETDPATVSLASGQVQFVEFFAYWCPTCKAMAPTVHGLEAIYSDRVNFVYLDRDKESTAQLREALGYVYQPHFFLLDAEGNVLANWVGYVEGEELQLAIEEAIN